MPPSTQAVAGRYRLDAEVGRGGMGVVWKAYDQLLQRAVAVKELHFPADIADDERERLARRTLREARAVAAVDDDHAVRVFDIVEQDGRPWIVMEYVDGQTLTELIRSRGALPTDQVARIGHELVQALAAAHAAGVLHRDVKPSNVLIRDDGRVALTDFGIALVDSDTASTTTSGVLIGSPAYMSPERARGEPPGPASDIWSLGATLWTAAEGVPPYQRDSAIATLAAVVSDDPPPCRVCDRALSQTLQRMMAKDPAQRPTFHDLRDTLGRIAATPPAADTVVLDPYPTEVLDPGFDRTIAVDTRQRAAVVAAPVATAPAADAAEPAAPPGTATAAPTVPAGASAQAADRRRRTPWLPLTVVALVVAAAVVAALLLTGGNASHRSTGQAPPSQAAPPSASASATASRPATSSDAPKGWTRYTDPSVGWSVAVPQDWQVQHNGAETDFQDPSGGRYLRVDTRYPAGPSAKGAWQDQEKAFRKSHDGYHRITLADVDYRGYDAADWEFTYREGGATLHALDRGFVAGDRGYAMYFQTHDDQWGASTSVMHQIWDTFRPAS